MSNEYPVDVRRSARRLWLRGDMTDEQVAANLCIPRADTIRDWRHEEGWVGLARDITGVIDDQVKARVRAEHGAFKMKYDQLGQVLESRAVRALSDPDLPPRDLKAIAGTLAVAQKIRDKALGGDAAHEKDKIEGTIAGIIQRNRQGRADRERGNILGRCQTGTSGVLGEAGADASGGA